MLPTMLLAVSFVMWSTSTSDVGLFVGMPTCILDGDTIVINDTKIRLKDINAPEVDSQSASHECLNGTSAGQLAKMNLSRLVIGKTVACTSEGIDCYGRRLGYCYANHLNVNQAMVRSGYAVHKLYKDLQRERTVSYTPQTIK